jgi:hypothetical protein
MEKNAHVATSTFAIQSNAGKEGQRSLDGRLKHDYAVHSVP